MGCLLFVLVGEESGWIEELPHLGDPGDCVEAEGNEGDGCRESPEMMYLVALGKKLVHVLNQQPELAEGLAFFHHSLHFVGIATDQIQSVDLRAGLLGSCKAVSESFLSSQDSQVVLSQRIDEHQPFDSFEFGVASLFHQGSSPVQYGVDGRHHGLVRSVVVSLNLSGWLE